MRRWHDHRSPSGADLTKPVMEVLRHVPEVEVVGPVGLREAAGKKLRAGVKK